MSDIRKHFHLNKESYLDSLYRLVTNLIGNLFPIFGSFIIFVLSKKWQGFQMFTDDGEFALYSAAFLSPTVYMLWKSKRGTDHLGIIILLADFIFLLSAAFLFASTTLKGTLSDDILQFDYDLLQQSTLILFSLSCAIFFFVQVRENIRANPNYQESRSDNYQDLKSKFEAKQP